MSRIDPGEYQERLDRITEVFAGMVAHADETAPYRCPYRDRHDLCTALFKCRNQREADDDPDTLMCGHDGTFDYRDAWEAHPRNRERMKRKIAAIRSEGKRRRAEPEAGEDPA